MKKKGSENTTLQVIFILIVVALAIVIIYAFLHTKIGGIFKGI